MRFRRRKYIVDVGFQWRFVLGFVAVSLIGSVVSAVLFNLFSMKGLEELQWSVHISAQSTGEVLKPLFIYFNLLSFVFVLVLLLITGVWMMRKVNGPLYHIIRDLEKVKGGDFSSMMSVRQGDEFQDLVKALNEMQGQIRDRFRRFREGYEEVSKALVELEITHAKGAPTKQIGENLLAKVRTLQKQLLPPPP